MQGFFSSCGLALAVAAGLAGEAPAQSGDLRKNIVVLVDSSKSVDPANRDSALKLVAGLVTGRVDEATRAPWSFKPAPSSGYPVATINLQRLVEGSPDKSEPIAADAARFVVNPLGNYERVAALRAQLAQPRSGGPTDIAGLLMEPGRFVSSDNSTHISLAEAVVAQAFLRSSAQMPYYLVVISDFNEDCLNKPADDYRDAKKRADLTKENLRVFGGEIPFNDGSGAANGKYSGPDVEAIRFLNEKITDLLLGEFIYRGSPMPAHPVNVKIYSPMVKRGLKFGAGGQRWVLPDAPPSLEVATEGLDMNAPLEVKIANLETKQERVVKETCSLILARGRLELGALMERAEIKLFMQPGRYQVTLSAGQAIGLTVDAKAELEIVRPGLTVEDPKLDGSTEGKPFEFPPNKEILGEKVVFKLDPAPAEEHTLVVQAGTKRAEVVVRNGVGVLPLGELLESAGGTEPIQLAAGLPLPPTEQSATKAVWLLLPQMSIWAVYGGEIVGGDAITLKQARALSLKASHVGMEGMEWRGTTVLGPDGQPAAMGGGDLNNLDFSGLAPGTYAVTAKFGTGKAPQQASFTVVVPKKTPWMPIVLGGMVLVSLSLLAWHFIRR